MIEVRVAVEGDIPRILEIADEAISPAWTHASVQERLGRDDTLLLAAVEREENNTNVVGFAAFRQVGDDGELLQIAVDAKKRQHGIGRILLAEVLEHAARLRAASVFLEVRESNEAAIAFYKKHGFEQVRVRKAYYSDPAEDAIIMCRGDLWSPAGERSSPLQEA